MRSSAEFFILLSVVSDETHSLALGLVHKTPPPPLRGTPRRPAEGANHVRMHSQLPTLLFPLCSLLFSLTAPATPVGPAAWRPWLGHGADGRSVGHGWTGRGCMQISANISCFSWLRFMDIILARAAQGCLCCSCPAETRPVLLRWGSAVRTAPYPAFGTLVHPATSSAVQISSEYLPRWSYSSVFVSDAHSHPSWLMYSTTQCTAAPGRMYEMVGGIYLELQCILICLSLKVPYITFLPD